MARRVADRLAGATTVAVATHVNGDGDGWGSACALAYHLRPRGIEVALLAATPYPDRFRFLLPPDLEPRLPDPEACDLLAAADVQVVVDASEVGRLGEFGPHYEPQRTVIIDHHAVASNPMSAALMFTDADAAATAELVYDTIAAAGDPLSPEIAQALYVGLVTDTGSFRYSNATPHAHRLAARLIEAGADPEALYGPLFANVSAAELATLDEALSRLHAEPGPGLTWTTIPLEVTRRHGRLEDYEVVIEHLRNLQGTRVAVLLRELEDGTVKVSLRSSGSVNVARVASEFGGGGHEKAAGAVIAGGLAEVSRRLLDACRRALRNAGP
jgi:phosphoesterase RecJ-like protein